MKISNEENVKCKSGNLYPAFGQGTSKRATQMREVKYLNLRRV
jgi:hypothetical protein